MMNKPLGRKFKLGLVVNPFAGIGGALAMKGSDGKDIREQALAQGAEQLAMHKARIALQECIALAQNFCVYTGNADLGESICQQLGLEHHIVHMSKQAQTEIEDTLKLVEALQRQSVDLILFAGGDGTARNVCSIVHDKLPVLGVPAGCKIHSGVYAITPKAAGKVLSQVIKGELVSVQSVEVRDIDESQFREGRVIAKHFGEMLVPLELSYIQAVKMGGKESDELLLDDLAEYIQEIMDDHPDHYFVMGSGSTVASIMAYMNLPNTLLGVDVVYQSKVIAQDLKANELEQLTQSKLCKLVITSIGGQGHILGRGNQQLSPSFIKRLQKSDILIVATKAKLNGFADKGFISDSGDATLDESLSGPISVITGYRDHVLYFIRGEI